MKKIITQSILSFAILLTGVQKVNCQVVEQGNVIIEPYYGFGTITASLLKSITDNSSAKSRSVGPTGIRFDYMMSNKIGFGLDVQYSSNHITWSDTDTANSSIIYNYEFNINRLRFMPRFSIHFGGSDKFDGFFTISAGYRNSKFTWKSNDPTYDGSTTLNLIPFAFRLSVGGRYFITDYFGLFMELGVSGGAIIHGGFSFKL
jgi:hypothetical protein